MLCTTILDLLNYKWKNLKYYFLEVIIEKILEF